MKKLKTLVLGLICCAVSPTLSIAQRTISGAAAHELYADAEVVRESNFSDLPSYIKFRKSKQFDIDNLKKWMTSNVKFDSNMGFVLLRVDTDELGHVHYRYQQTFNGKPIEDAIWIAHTNNDKVYALNGLIYKSIVTPTSIGLSESIALEKAKADIAAVIYKWQIPGEEQHLKWESGDPTATYLPKGELVYVSSGGDFNANSYRLAYKFNVYAHQPISRDEIYVDANTGEIIRKISILCHADTPGTAHTAYSGSKPIIADSFGGQFRLRDASRGDGIRTFDMNQGTAYGSAVDFTDADNDWNNINPQKDEYATDAHWGSEMTYDYYFEMHGRNSIDNAGFQLNSYVHYDVGYDNAFWDGSRMTYGDGNVAFTPLTSIDVAGHEITHGLTTFTAGLVYSMESGALNESFSDIFGTAIENYGRPEDWDWLIGDDIGISGPLRSMSNPNAEGDPDTYFGDFWAPLGGGDSGGVHTNSGVQNFWYYLLTEGGSGVNDNGDSYAVTGIGFESSSAIAFRNLTVYLVSSSQFDDARFFAIESAIDLFGTCTFEVEQTANAWYAVGVGDIYSPVTSADFTATETNGCALPFTTTFVNTSENAITYSWDFGDGATSTEESPTHTYTTAGTYTVTLFADGGDCGTDEIIMVDYITVDPDADCIVTLPETGTASVQNGCIGSVYDSGGPGGDYGTGEDAQVTISPFGAVSVSLSFPIFAVEAGPGVSCDYDYVEIYDGASVFAPLIGRYCDNNLPTDMTSSGSSITILFHSDGGVEDTGFKIDWECNLPAEAPVANFSSNSAFSCNGDTYFVDLSTNSPTSWYWEFGDGGTSTEQNPMHTYAANGIYDVTLTATNVVGGDTYTELESVTVELMVNPTTTDDNICQNQAAILVAEGSADLNWYTAPTGGTPLFTGETYTTPVLAATTTYYVQSYIASESFYVGAADNTFGGGGNFNGDQHLVFDCEVPVILKSVKVYANGSGNRTIELRNADGSLIESKIINIPDGESRIDLGFQLPIATGLQLGTAAGSSPNMYRNNSGVPAYPFAFPEHVTIQESSAGLDYYYFFYDWEILTYECESDRVPVMANLVDCLGINELAETEITVYPNPTTGMVTINTGSITSGKIEVADLLGRVIATIPFNQSTFSVDLGNYHASGTYIVSFFDQDNNLITLKKVVKS